MTTTTPEPEAVHDFDAASVCRTCWLPLNQSYGMPCTPVTDDDPETCTCGGCPRCGGCLVPMDADLLPCEPWTCFCDLV